MTARTARESLARGLSALQADPNVPPQLLEAASPIAQAMGGKVDRLARVAYGPVRLGDLAPGEWRPLTPQEERGIYRAIGMTPEED